MRSNASRTPFAGSGFTAPDAFCPYVAILNAKIAITITGNLFIFFQPQPRKFFSEKFIIAKLPVATPAPGLRPITSYDKKLQLRLVLGAARISRHARAEVRLLRQHGDRPAGDVLCNE